MPAAPLDVHPLAPDEPFRADLVLAGHGVIATGAVPALNDFAARTGLGVLNTFTAKGVFRWDSPYHLGTGCLQERDLLLAGTRADSPVLVVGVDTDEVRPALLRATGIDPARLRESAWRSLPATDLAEAAPRITPTWGLPPTPPPQPEMFRVMWDLAQPLYKLEAAPLNPARAASDIVAALGIDGVVCAEAGARGLVGRPRGAHRAARERPGAGIGRARARRRAGARGRPKRVTRRRGPRRPGERDGRGPAGCRPRRAHPAGRRGVGRRRR